MGSEFYGSPSKEESGTKYKTKTKIVRFKESLQTEPFELVRNTSYTNSKNVRLISDISLRINTITYIENPDGSHILGECSIEEFFSWMEE